MPFVLCSTIFLFIPFHIGGGTCLKEGGPRKIVTEKHVQMREGSECQYCLMFLFN